MLSFLKQSFLSVSLPGFGNHPSWDLCSENRFLMNDHSSRFVRACLQITEINMTQGVSTCRRQMCRLYFSLALRRIWYRMSLLATVIFCSCKGYPEDALTDELRTKSLESLSRVPLR